MPNDQVRRERRQNDQAEVQMPGGHFMHREHPEAFATLRALGSSSGYIHRVILAQAALSAVLGYALGMIIAMTVVYMSEQTPLPIIMTPGLAALLLGLTVAMCAISALSAIGKVMRIDPAVVFNR